MNKKKILLRFFKVPSVGELQEVFSKQLSIEQKKPEFKKVWVCSESLKGELVRLKDDEGNYLYVPPYAPDRISIALFIGIPIVFEASHPYLTLYPRTGQ